MCVCEREHVICDYVSYFKTTDFLGKKSTVLISSVQKVLPAWQYRLENTFLKRWYNSSVGKLIYCGAFFLVLILCNNEQGPSLDMDVRWF